MEVFGAYTSVLELVSVALLLVLAGIGKKRLAWRRPQPLPVRSRRRDR